MSVWAIEVNDAGLQLVSSAGVRAVEPGYALFEPHEILLGRAARERCRLRPQQTVHFWRELSVAPLADPQARGRSSAELAAMQLAQLWALAEDNPCAVFAVPGEFDRAQLGALLGAARAASIPIEGVVDSAVAATQHGYPGWQILHVDVGLHQLRLTHLSQTDGVRRTRFDALPDTGLLVLRDRWLRAIAQRFIDETRFDPLHDAATEQLLHDQLDGWLLELRKADVLEIALESGGLRRVIELRRRDLLASTQSIYQSLLRWIGTRRAPGAPLALHVGHRLTELPGVLDTLQRLEDAVLVPCAPEAPALGALARADAIHRAEGVPTLVLQLPLREPPVELERPDARRAPGDARPPTHLLYRGIAHPLAGRTFSIGTAEVALHAGLRLAEPEPLSGISRHHCALFYRGGELILQDQSRYGTFVNELRVASELALRPGDVIRIGVPGVELQVIATVNGDAA